MSKLRTFLGLLSGVCFLKLQNERARLDQLQQCSGLLRQRSPAPDRLLSSARAPMQAGWAGQAGVGATRTWNSPGKKTGVGSHSLLQGIFATQGLNPGLPHCRRILYHQRPPGRPHLLCHGQPATLSPTASSAAVCQLPCGFAVNSCSAPPSTKAWM